MESEDSKVIAFLKEWPDERRHPQVVDTEDWDELTEILVEWGTIALAGAERGPTGLSLSLLALKVICEAIYCMGIERGKSISNLASFLEGDDEKEANLDD